MHKGRGILRLIFVLATLTALFVLTALPTLAMQVFVKTDKDRVITLEVEPTYLVEEVRAKIQEKEGLIPGEYDLMFSGKALQDGNTLQDYSIQKETTLIISAHSYTDCTDATCNNEGCTVTREASGAHAYTDCTDTDCNNEGCTVTREAGAHIGTNLSCTDPAVCEVCDARFAEPLSHEPSGIWVCAEATHYQRCLYWNEYSSCKEIYHSEPHSYGEWITVEESGYFKEGVRQRSCICGKTETENTSMRSILDEDVGKREILVVGAVAVGILMLWGVAHFINRP